MAVTYPGLNPTQAAKINQAVSNAFTGWKSESAGQIDQSINNALTSSGLFSAAQLGAISEGEQAAEPHGPGFIESDIKGGNFSAFVKSWTSNIASALGQLNQTSGSGSSGSSGSSASSDPVLSELAGALATQPQAPSLPTPELYSYPTAGGVNPIAIVLLGGAAALGYWWWKHRKEHGHSEKE